MDPYYANQVPQRGDLLCLSANWRGYGPDDRWGMWRVTDVIWMAANRGSDSARAISREQNIVDSNAYCVAAELIVMPAQGPHWAKTPPWQKLLSPGDEGEEIGDGG
jgi:hypothetical protein